MNFYIHSIIGISTKSSNYYWGYYKNAPLSNSEVSVILISTEHQPVSYFVEAPAVARYYNGTFAADNTNSTVINFPSDLMVSSHVEQHKGIHASVYNGRVTMIGQIEGYRSSDTFLVLPTVSTCTINPEHVYYGMSVSRSPSSPYTSIILIIGTTNNTAMKLTVTQLVNISVGSITTELIPSREYSFVINRLQTVFIESLEDLTGTKIVTNNQVSVLGGHEAGNIPQATDYADHLVEQIPSTEFWGKVYYTAPLATRVSYTIKILAAYNSTSVTIYCNDVVEPFVINEGKFIKKTLRHQEYCAIHSNKKVLVVQFSHGAADDFDGNMMGDPMMTLVPAVNHYLNQLDFSTIRNSSSYKHYINIIVMEQYYQPSMMYLITGGVNRSLASQDWIPIVVNNITEAYATQVAVSEGVIQIVHANSTALMTAIAYGFKERGAYGHPGGLLINKG